MIRGMNPDDAVVVIRSHLVTRQSDGKQLLIVEGLADDGRLIELFVLTDD